MVQPMNEQALIDLAVEQGYLSRDQVNSCLRALGTASKTENSSLTSLLLESGLLTQETLEKLDRIHRERTASPPPRRKKQESPIDKRPQDIPPEALPFADNPDYCFKDFILTRELGRGGMGVVWKAWQRSLHRWVAIKFLESDTPDELDRFIREAQSVAALSHPNITALYELGQFEGKYYIVMEYVEGDTLQKHMGHLPPDRALKIFHICALALDHAHRHGIIHRDIKPHNIILAKSDKPYLMDFGLAKQRRSDPSVTTVGTILGTPAYMSPEQAEGKIPKVDKRSDVYSLGASLYAALAGRPPFVGHQVLDTLYKVVHSDPLPLRNLNPQVSQEVEAVVAKAMAKHPIERYANARDFANDLQRCLSGQAVQALPKSTIRVLRGAAHKHRTAVLAATGVTVLLFMMLLVSGETDSAARRSDTGTAGVVDRSAVPSVPLQPAISEYEAAQAALRSLEGTWAQVEIHAQRGLALLDQILAQHPKAVEAQLLRGKLWALLENYAESERDLAAIQDPRARVELLKLFVGIDEDRVRKYAKPEELQSAELTGLQVCLTLEERSSLAKLTDMLSHGEDPTLLFLRARTHERLGNGRDALTDMKRALSIAPHRTLLVLESARIAEGLQEILWMEDLLTRFLRFRPRHAEAQMALARAKLNLGQAAEAVMLANQAIELEPQNFRLYGHRAWILERLGRYSAAISDANRHLGRFPEDAHVLLVRGNAWYSQEESKPAMADWSEALRIDPHSLFARLNLAQANVKSGHHPEAQGHLEEALQSHSISVLGWQSLAEMLHWLGLHNQGLRAIDRAILLNPRYLDAHRLRFRLLLAMQTWEESARQAKHFFDLTQQRSIYESDLAQIETGRGAYERALSHFEVSLRLAPEDAITYHARSICYERMGRWEDAVADLRTAIQLNPALAPSLRPTLRAIEERVK